MPSRQAGSRGISSLRHADRLRVAQKEALKAGAERGATSGGSRRCATRPRGGRGGPPPRAALDSGTYYIRTHTYIHTYIRTFYIHTWIHARIHTCHRRTARSPPRSRGSAAAPSRAASRVGPCPCGTAGREGGIPSSFREGGILFGPHHREQGRLPGRPGPCGTAGSECESAVGWPRRAGRAARQALSRAVEVGKPSRVWRMDGR
jgi:hypothetical protein